MIHIRYGPANNCLPDLRIDLHCLLIFGFRFVHDLDVEWNDIDSDMLPYIVEQGGVDKPFKAVCHNLDFIVDTLEDHRGDITFHKSFFRFYDLNILRADHNVHRSVISKTFIDTRNLYTEDFHDFVLDHSSIDDIAVTDKVCDESVRRFIVDHFRCTDLLDVSLIHNDDRIGHGKCFFLVMCDVNESDSKFVFQADQLVLHILTQF